MADTEQTTTEMVIDAPAGETPAGNTAPDAAALTAELESIRKALKGANAEAADRRKKLDAFEKAEEERKLAAMTELERSQTEVERLKAEIATANANAQQVAISSAVTLAATKLSFHDPADAVAFLDTSKLDTDGVDDALKELATARPYLIRNATTPDIDAGKRSTTKSKDLDERKLAATYGITIYDD